jgi:tyrosyl-tRNA synthetase
MDHPVADTPKTMTSPPIDFLAELQWRGLIKDCTDLEGLRAHLAEPASQARKAYAGFDPTADSLTIGNLVPIMMLVHFARAGHEPVVLMGGGTGLIGDPSGKSAERQLMTEQTVAGNITGQRPIFANVFRGAGLPEPRIVNNADWLSKLSAIELLRDVGKHFSINQMMGKESVRERLQNRDQGISYTEFSYMILQAYDFLYLFQYHEVTVQMGGSDQYGNITAGSDLIRREKSAVVVDTMREIDRLGQASGRLPLRDLPDIAAEIRSGLRAISEEAPLNEWSWSAYRTLAGLIGHWHTKLQQVDKNGSDLFRVAIAACTPILQRLYPFTSDSYGLTCPLVTKADGGKFGKSETGAIWLTADRTSPYAMYQFWLNTADEDVIPFLKKFTLLTKDEIEAIEAAHLAEPGKREAQRTLAILATSLVHGTQEAQAALQASAALFSGDITGLSMSLLEQIFAEVPASLHDRATLQAEGIDLVDVLIETTLAKSKREAREFVANGSISVNGQKASEGSRLVQSNLLHGQVIALRRGKKAWHLTRWK